MLLSQEQAERFFRLHSALMFFVNERLGVVSDVGSPDEFSSLDSETRWDVRDALLAERDLIDLFVDANPLDLPDDELAVVSSWRHLVAGKFFVFRYLKQHAVFLSGDEPAVAYGVTALMQPLDELIGPYLPVWVDTVLLPFEGKIVYDGLLTSHNITFGGGFKRSLNESYKEAKARLGVVTSLPLESWQPPAAKTIQKRPRRGGAKKDPENVKQVLRVIADMTDEFCREKLNDEYADLCRELAEKLARKRPSPLLSGRPTSWASGIVRTIGFVNFLDDPSTSPYLNMTAVDEAFGVATSTGQGKSRTIRSMFAIDRFDPEWTLPSQMDDNPMVWMLELNGFAFDIRHAPRELQEAAFAKGLIPYIPETCEEQR